MGRTHINNTFRALLLVAFVALISVLFHRSDESVLHEMHDAGLKSLNDSKENRAGFPDRYAEYMAQIRTADWEKTPSYPQNYLMDALEEARTAAKSGGDILPWSERGPGNVGGRTRALVVDPDDPSHDTWYAAAVSGGIWKTTNEGLSWTHLTSELPNLAFSTLVQAPANSNVFYAGSGEGFFNGDAVAGAGVFKSIDRGNAWIQLAATASDPDFRFVNRLIVSPSDENIVVAASRKGIFRTVDGGGTWSMSYSASTVPGVLQVIADPSDFDRQYASESGLGVLRSTNGGVSWSPASVGLFGLDDGAIGNSSRLELAISPSNPLRLYASVESKEGTDKLFMSPNGGDIWVPVEARPLTPNPDWTGSQGSNQGWYDNAIAVHPFDENTVFLGGIHLYRATLSGTTEIGVVTSLEEENTGSFLDFVSFNSATHFGGRLKTGLSENGANVSEEDFVSVEVRFGPGRSQFAHRFTPPDGPGIPFSTYPHAGYVVVPFEVWDITNNRQLMVSFRDRLGDGEFNLIPRDTNNLGREYIVIHATPYNGSVPDPHIALSGGPLHKLLYFFWPMLADDASWNPSNLPMSVLRINYETVMGSLRSTAQISTSGSVHVDQHAIIPIITDEESGTFELLIGNDGGIFHSKNGGVNWVSRNSGFNTSQYYSVDKRPAFEQYIGGTQDNGTWRSRIDPTKTQSWLPAFGGDGFDVVWNQRDHLLLLGSIQFNDFRRSTNAGGSWSTRQSGMTDVGDPNNNGGGQFVTTLDRGSSDSDVVFTIGKSGVWKSTNFGATWSLISIPASAWGFRGSGKVRVSLANDAIVWAGYEMGVALTGPDDVLGRLHVSTDFGATFNPVPTPTDLSSGQFSGLATHPTDSQTAFVLFSAFGKPKVLRTRDLGQSWEDLSGFAGTLPERSSNGFPDVAVFDLLVMPHRPIEIWAGTEIGLFISTDDGQSWQFANNGLPAVSIWRMRIVDDQVVIATHGRGVWTVEVSDLIAIDIDGGAQLPSVFSLDPNYPNPFNPETTISFTVPEPEDVKIAVYDGIGRRVATLLDDLMPAGRHQVSWNAQGLASGIYLVHMTAGSFVETQKMTLLK